MNNIEEHIFLNNLGMIFKNQNKIEKAIDFFEKALALHEDVFIWVNLGHAHMLNKDVFSAINCYKSAIRLQENFAPAHLNLAHAYLIIGDYQKGWAEYEYRLQC